MRIGMVSIFPEMFRALNHGITGRALEHGLLDIDYYNPRDYTLDKHRNVDDKPYGGGPGMVMMVQPIRDAIGDAKTHAGGNAHVIFMTPQGRCLNHEAIMGLSRHENLVILAGRYEGIDERIREFDIDAEWSLGDYVISGGELAAMVLIDAIIRQIPGSLGHEESNKQDSFATGLLDFPHYTRPEIIDDQIVPPVLLSGDHQAISRFRRKLSLGRTWLRRPDILHKLELSSEDQKILNEFIAEYGENNE